MNRVIFLALLLAACSTPNGRETLPGGYRSDGRRGDPELIYRAQRAGIFRRPVDEERLSELDAEHWIARWEREAEATGRSRC